MSLLGDAADLLDEDLGDVQLIGRGSTGEVYRARQLRLDRDVAVKVIRTGPLSTRTRSASEATAQARVSWHANVLTVYDEGELPDGTTFLVMEYAPGGSLLDRIRREGPLASDEILTLGRELSAALAAAHDAGLVHCDVKPANVLFAADGSSRLADFGIARSVDLTTRTFDSLGGSLAYVPPELLDGDPPKPSNDVYSLALTLWTAATGRLPFDAESQPPAAVIAALRTAPPSFSDLEQLPDQIRALLQRAASATRTERPSAAQIADALHISSQLPKIEKAAPVSRMPRRLRWPKYAAIAATAGVAAGMLVRSPPQSPDAAPAPPDLCGAYQAFVNEREELFNSVSVDLEMGTSAATVVERLLVDYPQDYARAVHPFLEAVRFYRPSIPQVSTSLISQQATASILKALADGKSFVFDGESGEFSPAGLPWQVRLPIETFSESTSYADQRCETVSNLTPAKARMRSAIRSNFLDSEFMDDFFSDDRSYDLMSPDLVLMMASISRWPLEVLLSGHWDWFVELSSRKTELRQSLAAEHPDLFLTALKNHPESISRFSDEWREEIEAGIRASGRASQVGMGQVFGEQLTLLGIEIA